MSGRIGSPRRLEAVEHGADGPAVPSDRLRHGDLVNGGAVAMFEVFHAAGIPAVS